MRRHQRITAIITLVLAFTGPAWAENIAGTWTKTTHPDPNNIIVFFREAERVKATGYERVGGAPAYWHGEGTVRNGQIELHYHYSADATPPGWEPEGTMRLALSADGRSMEGTATSATGQWSDRIVLRRISFVMQP